MSAWRAAAFAALIEADPARKCQQLARLTVDAEPESAVAFEWARVPGRPEQPLLVSPRDVPTRGLGSVAGRAALAHAVAHIEFNAINLALDAACRFDGLPLQFYRDWISVAQDEARHFQLLEQRLDALGSHYGALTAHNGLWEAAEKTAHDALVRMALVPRVLEARGLDVTPGMIERLRGVGDVDTVAVLDVILTEELRHVAIGTHWFRYLCEQRGLSSTETFKALLAEHSIQLRQPLNLPARYAAGFVESELT